MTDEDANRVVAKWRRIAAADGLAEPWRSIAKEDASTLGVEAQPPGLLIRVSLVLDIIDEVERDHDVDLHDIAARIRERIEEATR